MCLSLTCTTLRVALEARSSLLTAFSIVASWNHGDARDISIYPPANTSEFAAAQVVVEVDSSSIKSDEADDRPTTY